MSRYCSSCGSPIEEHTGRGALRMCPIQPADQYPAEGKPVRFVRDKGQYKTKARARARERKQLAEAEQGLKELEERSGVDSR